MSAAFASQVLLGAKPVSAIQTKEEKIPVESLSSFQRADQRNAYLAKAQGALKEVRGRCRCAWKAV